MIKQEEHSGLSGKSGVLTGNPQHNEPRVSHEHNMQEASTEAAVSMRGNNMIEAAAGRKGQGGQAMVEEQAGRDKRAGGMAQAVTGKPKARKHRKTGKRSKNERVTNLISIIVGAFVIAVSFNSFLLPNDIASGGINGLSILIEHLYGFNPAFIQWAINIPLFFAGMLLLGRRFALQTLVGTIFLPLFVLLTSHWGVPTENPLLASIYGGIGVGLGLGLVFRGRGSTGGTALIAQILHRYTGMSLGLCIALMDGLVIVAAGILLSPEQALYALIGLFVTSKTIDIVQTGLAMSKVAFIISSRSEEIADAVLHDLDRGLTRLDGHGGYTGDNRTVLMVVLSQNEVPELKRLVQTVDRDAFVIISHTAEVLGQGFKLE